MFEYGAATKLAADLGHNYQCVGFALPNTKFGDVILDVVLVMIVVARIVELLAARCFQIVNPSEAVLIDEIGVEAKSDDDQIFRRPADSAAEVFHILTHLAGDVQPAWVVVTTQQQHTAAASPLVRCKPSHHLGAAV